MPAAAPRRVFDQGRYNALPLLDPACPLDLGASFGDCSFARRRPPLKLPLCRLLAREEPAPLLGAGAQTELLGLGAVFGEKLGSGLRRPLPREAAVMAYSQKVVEEDEEGADGAAPGTFTGPVGLVGSVFGPAIGGAEQEQEQGQEQEQEQEQGQGQEQEQEGGAEARKGDMPPLRFTAFLRPPPGILTGQYRAKVLAPQVALSMQLAGALTSQALQTERHALLRKEAVDDLRKDLLRKHKSLQNKLDKDRHRQLAEVQARALSAHNRAVDDLRRAHEAKQRQTQLERQQREAAAQGLVGAAAAATGGGMGMLAAAAGAVPVSTSVLPPNPGAGAGAGAVKRDAAAMGTCAGQPAKAMRQ
jgi:hypothetical protein